MMGRPDLNADPSEGESGRPAQQKRSAGFLFSGVLIGISLLAFVLPLAAYHVAQVASMTRARAGILLLLIVSFFLYLLGVVTRVPVFVVAGSLGFLISPLMAGVLYIRQRSSSAWWALFVLSLPVVLMLMSLLSVPQGFNIEQRLSEEFAKTTHPELLAQRETLLKQLQSSAALIEMQRLFDLESWQRLAWFLFSGGGALALTIFGSLAGTLVLLDFAYAQAERLRGIVKYVLSRPESFPQSLLSVVTQTKVGMAALQGAKMTMAAELERGAVVVSSHAKKIPENKSTTGGMKSLLGSVLREPSPRGTSLLWGYRFKMSAEPGWHLGQFAVPLWLGFPSLLVLGYLATLWQGEKGLSQWLSQSPFGEQLLWAAVLAVGVLVGLAVQGALVLYVRLRPWVALLSVLAVILLSSATDTGPLVMTVVLAAVGLLDNAYDFRKRLAKSEIAL